MDAYSIYLIFIYYNQMCNSQSIDYILCHKSLTSISQTLDFIFKRQLH